MGTRQSSNVVDPNFEFTEVIGNKCNSTFHYPSNEQFRQRVKPHEWDMFMEEFGSRGRRVNIFVVVVLLLMIIVINVGIHLIPSYSFIIWALAIPLFLQVVLSRGKWMRYTVERYNVALFFPRGIGVMYYESDKNSPSRIRVSMIYPANSMVINQAPSPDLEEIFRDANAEFSRSAIGSAAGPAVNANSSA